MRNTEQSGSSLSGRDLGGASRANDSAAQPNESTSQMNGSAAQQAGHSKPSRRRRSSGLVTVILILVMIAGVGIMLYPTFSNWYNGLHQSRAIVNYNETVSSNDDARNEEMWEAALAYNEELAKTGTNFALSQYNAENPEGSESTDADPSLAAAREKYQETLDVSGTGIMGYINIDKVNIHLPIYHDTNEGVLQIAVGHIAGTSLPVGGESSHCVLTGHTGLPSAKLFTDIDQLEIGDTFQLVVLDHVLTYEVSDIQVVLPDELDSLQIVQGEDLCTLVTCTPYGINTHRLLVTGKRIATPETASEDTADADEKPSADWQRQQSLLVLKQSVPILIGVAVIVCIVLLIVRYFYKKKNNGITHHDKDGQ